MGELGLFAACLFLFVACRFGTLSMLSFRPRTADVDVPSFEFEFVECLGEETVISMQLEEGITLAFSCRSFMVKYWLGQETNLGLVNNMCNLKIWLADAKG